MDNVFSSQHEFSQLSKSIMSHTRWERKGKLNKKNFNSDEFKQRHFELVRDNLYYYKSERTKEEKFTCIILNNADIRMYSSDSPIAAIEKLPDYIKDRNSSYFILEIENESRPFVLRAKSHFDLEQWFNAIYAQIESLKTNRAINRTTLNVKVKEKEMAVADQRMVLYITKEKMVFSPEVQPQLLDFVRDAFIMELLPGITKYLLYVESRDVDTKRSLQKADEVL